jgi:hypothetical protein
MLAAARLDRQVSFARTLERYCLAFPPEEAEALLILGYVTLRRAKQVQGSLTKLADLACTAFGIGSRHELSARWTKVMEQFGPMAPALFAPFRPELETILAPEFMPEAGAPYDGNFVEKVFHAIDDDAAGIKLWRGLLEESAIALMTIFKGVTHFLRLNVRRDASALASAIPHRRGGGRPPEKWPDPATCREMRRKVQSLHDSGFGIPKMEAYERVADEYGKSPRMVRRVCASQKYASQK